MKRFLIATVLMVVVLAVVAAPAFAYLDQGSGYTATTAPTVAVPHPGILGVATPQGKTARVVVFRGHGVNSATVPMTHGSANVAIALLLVAVIGIAVYALASYRRPAPAESAAPTHLPAFKPNAEQKHKAA